MKNLKKKGFTIVELVIVIAVIAILAAVLIPTFVNLTKKANMSADEQAVRQMNTALAVEGILGGDDIFSVYDALTEMGMTAKDYKPLTKDTYFFWDANKKCILYVDNNNKVIYPKEYEGQIFNASTDTWLSLSMTINKKAPADFSTEKIGSGNIVYEVKINSPEELSYVVDEINKKAALGVKNINMTLDLNGNTLDMMGSNISIDKLIYSRAGKCFTIKNGTIKNITSVDTSKYGDGKTEGQDKQYGVAGLITMIEGYSSVILENLTIENVHVKNTHAGNVGILVGRNSGNLEINNVKIKNSSVIAHRSVGSLVGYNTKNITISDVEMENVKVQTVGGRSAFLVGYQNGNGQIVSAQNIVLNNCSYGFYKCNQNEGTFEETKLGFDDDKDKLTSWYYDGTMIPESKSYDYFEKVLIIDDSDGNDDGVSLLNDAVTGWNQ